MSLNCRAQNTILDISEKDGLNSITGVYYKDTHNLLDPFVGTYLYTNGNTSLKIVLQKKKSFNTRYYKDMLIGEYQYIENGVEKINTLNELNIDYINKSNHSINGGIIITQGDPGCNDCLPNEKALYGGLIESSTHNTANLIIRRTTENGIRAIKIFVMWNMRYKKDTDPMPPRASFPGGEYILTKRLER